MPDSRVIEITKKLIECPSVTPEDKGAQVYLAAELKKIGFDCTHLPFEDVPNLFARIGSEGKHLCYAGHTDVVPTGPVEKWAYDPFTPTIVDGILYGRGASDMKGSVAAFAVAVENYLAKYGVPENGSISMMITGDEEGLADFGTKKMLEWLDDRGELPDVCLVGEPTNPDHLGQEIKVGRRGSLTGWLIAKGKQGHVAYQHEADNPLPRLAKLVSALAEHEFDQGSEFFAPTNLEFTTIDVGNEATNVIPGSGQAVFNIRFNDHWSGTTLEAKVREVLDATNLSYELETRHNSESFLTPEGDWTKCVQDSVTEIVGKTPELSTKGGTSDAKFISQYLPVVEFGPINKTIHQIDENARVQDLEKLTLVYERVLEKYFGVS